MALNPGTNKQVPEHSIMDRFDKQVYLGNGFIFSSQVDISDTTETPIFSLQNPAVAAHGFPAGYVSLFLNLIRGISLTASSSVVFRLYYGPTVSAGTSKVPLNVRPASSTASIGTLKLSPTASNNGTLFDVIAGNAFDSKERPSLTILDPGKSILVTAKCSAAATVSVSLGWYEI